MPLGSVLSNVTVAGETYHPFSPFGDDGERVNLFSGGFLYLYYESEPVVKSQIGPTVKSP